MLVEGAAKAENGKTREKIKTKNDTISFTGMSITSKWSLSHWVIGSLIVTGVVFTLWDYSRWRHAELDNYGLGPKEKEHWQAARPLDKLYQNLKMGVRLRYPGDWEIKEKGEAVTIAQKNGEVAIKITTQTTNESMTEIANRMAVGATKDREHIKGQDETPIILLTWNRGGEIVQKALAGREKKLVILEVRCKSEDWNKWTLTIMEIYKSLAVF